jgi:hypothetical protein
MCGKAKSRCRLGKLKVNKLRRTCLNVMKLENYGSMGECLNNNYLISQKLYFFHNNFKDTKGTKKIGILIKNLIKCNLL